MNGLVHLVQNHVGTGGSCTRKRCRLAQHAAAITELTLASSRLISPHLAPSRLISPHLASSRLISPHLASSRLTSLHLASPRLTSPHLASSRLISPHPPHLGYSTAVAEIDPRSTRDRPEIDPRSTRDRPEIDPRSTRDRPEIGTSDQPNNAPEPPPGGPPLTPSVRVLRESPMGSGGGCEMHRGGWGGGGPL